MRMWRQEEGRTSRSILDGRQRVFHAKRVRLSEKPRVQETVAPATLAAVKLDFCMGCGRCPQRQIYGLKMCCCVVQIESFQEQGFREVCCKDDRVVCLCVCVCPHVYV